MTELPDETSQDPPAMEEAPPDGGQAEHGAEPQDESEALDRALQEAGGESAGWSRGEALGAREASEIAAERRTTVVILAGGTGSGKTTLLASLYERFGRGPLAGHLFDGSRTLHGLELRCHRSIYESDADDQGHTSLGALPWLHLRVKRDSQVIELLLGDYSGERFEALASGREIPSEFPQLRRADHLCIVLNGAALADPSKRDAEQREAQELLRALLKDPKSFAGASAISIVVAKWDLIVEGGTDAHDAVEETFSRLRREFDSQDTEPPIAYIETAARSTSSELPLGHGVDDLLVRWTDRPAIHIENPPVSEPIYVFGSSGYRAAQKP